MKYIMDKSNDEMSIGCIERKGCLIFAKHAAYEYDRKIEYMWAQKECQERF